MSSLPSLLAVIPARSGSKRVPGKNIRQIGGRPSIQYSIDAALHSGLFERVVVSTDSPEIAAVAIQCGAETPFVRSAELADDYTPVSDVTLDALERIDTSSHFDSVCQLMANCPLRNAQDVRDSYEQFSSSGARAQISVTDYGWLNPWWAMNMDTSHRLTHLMPEAPGKRSQDLPELFCPTGAVWWVKAEVLRAEKTFHTSDKCGWRIPWQRAVDVDSEDDWQMAEVLMQMQSGA